MDVLNHIRIDRFHFGGLNPGIAHYGGECIIDAYQHPDEQYTIIATERPDNPGTSITNGAEGLWTCVVGYFGITPRQLRAIEHYVWPDEPERYDLVLLRQGLSGAIVNVTWKHLPRSDWPDFLPVQAP